MYYIVTTEDGRIIDTLRCSSMVDALYIAHEKYKDAGYSRLKIMKVTGDSDVIFNENNIHNFYDE